MRRKDEAWDKLAPLVDGLLKTARNMSGVLLIPLRRGERRPFSFFGLYFPAYTKSLQLEPMNDLEEAKLHALVEFAAGAGHEINNPVATIVGYAQQLLAAETDPDRRYALATIGGQAYRIRDMIGDIMLFARPPQPRPERLELATVCREVVARFAADAADKDASIAVEAAGEVPIFADPVQLRAAFGALVRNSVEAAAAGGRIVVAVTRADGEGRSWAVVRVSDNGPGLSPTDREHLFDPFYSGRQAGRGLGFGLPKAWRIITLHGGRIDVESPHSGEPGVTFTIHWPASP